MRIENKQILSAGAIVTSGTSETIWVGHMALLAFQFSYSASASCVIKIQGSCDEGNPQGQSQSAMTSKVTNWTDIPNAVTSSFSGAGTQLINVVDTGCNWVRVVVTGDVTITSARMNAKGV